MEKNISSDPSNRNRIETVFDACKYRGCKNRRVTKGGVHLFRFPSRGDTRLLTWIKHTGNKLILNWSLSTLRKAGICGDHFSDDSFHNSDRTKLKSNAVPQPYEEPGLVITMQRIWDHTYSKEVLEEERDTENVADHLDAISESRQYKGLDKVKNESTKAAEISEGSLPWKTNLTFIKTYSRKLSFKDPDDSMEWTAIEPALPEDNVGELRASEALKQSVITVESVPNDALVEEHGNKEMIELRAINMELRRQNKMLRIENFKLQLRLATATQSKGER